MSRFIGAIDQGTTSSRFIVFNDRGAIQALAQQEHRQIFPKPGWVEHDAAEIRARTAAVIAEALDEAGLTKRDLAAVGITNQRETTVLWDRASGEPVHNALVWQDTRVDRLVEQYSANGGQDRFRERTGLPLASYFSALKLQWLLDNVDGARRRAEAGELAFGTIDSWIAWNLTGGARSGLHITDVTNASRTQLMNLESLQWDETLLDAFDIPAAVLPRIVPSSRVYGNAALDVLRGVPVAGMLGDQHAALVGQACFEPGDAKNTYGTGCFVLVDTGERPVASSAGLVTTVAHQLADEPPHYALEGSIAISGALVQWLRDNLEIISTSSEIEALAREVDDNGDIYVVPAFSGLYAPHWRADARGIIAGLTRYSNKAHLARAALEATAYQTRDVLDAMRQDSRIPIRELRADGGMIANELLMQFQADILDVPVLLPEVAETTALGAAYAAGLAVGFWSDREDIKRNWALARRFEPAMGAAERERLYASWSKAVTRSFGWASPNTPQTV